MMLQIRRRTSDQRASRDDQLQDFTLRLAQPLGALAIW